MPTLAAPSRAAAADVLLTAAAAGVDVPLTASPSFALTLDDGTVVTESNAACRAVAGLAADGGDALLGGGDAAARAVVSDWMARRHTTFNPVTEAGLKELNDHLLSRSFLAGGSAATLADVVLAAVLAYAVSNFPAAQVAHFPAVARWYDHIAATAAGADGELLPRGRLERPPLRAPVAAAPPAAAKKDAAAPAAAASGKGDAKKQGGDDKKDAAKAGDSAAAPAAAAAKKGAKAKPGKTPPAAAAAAAPARASDAYDLLDVRVGRILAAGKHPDADKLYVETIDFGEDTPRTVVSGLAEHVPLDALADRLVVCVCNLKPAAMRGVVSAAMVLCASAAGRCDPIAPPPGAKPGDRVTVAGFEGDPEPQINPKKKKTFDEVAAHLRTSADGVCQYKGIAMTVGGQPCTATVAGGEIK